MCLCSIVKAVLRKSLIQQVNVSLKALDLFSDILQRPGILLFKLFYRGFFAVK